MGRNLEVGRPGRQAAAKQLVKVPPLHCVAVPVVLVMAAQESGVKVETSG